MRDGLEIEMVKMKNIEKALKPIAVITYQLTRYMTKEQKQKMTTAIKDIQREIEITEVEWHLSWSCRGSRGHKKEIDVKPQLTMPILIIILLVFVGTGWVKNIIKLSECDFEAPYKAEIIHTVGLFPLVGAVTGWLNLGK